MSRHFYDTNYGSRFYPSQYSLGLAYEANNCTTLKVAYNSTLIVPLASTTTASAATTAPARRSPARSRRR